MNIIHLPEAVRQLIFWMAIAALIVVAVRMRRDFGRDRRPPLSGNYRRHRGVPRPGVMARLGRMLARRYHRQLREEFSNIRDRIDSRIHEHKELIEDARPLAEKNPNHD